MSRLDAMTPRKRGEKTFWTKIGSAFPNKNGPGYQIVLDALPLPDAEGRCVINLFEPKPREDDRGAAPSARHSADDEPPPWA